MDCQDCFPLTFPTGTYDGTEQAVHCAPEFWTRLFVTALLSSDKLGQPFGQGDVIGLGRLRRLAGPEFAASFGFRIWHRAQAKQPTEYFVQMLILGGAYPEGLALPRHGSGASKLTITYEL